MPEVLVPPSRWPRWVDNFENRHGDTVLAVAEGALRGEAADGATFVAHLPFAREYDDLADPDAFAAAAAPPPEWAVVLVRKGGFAVARMAGAAVVDSKVGRRHVQGRTKAGGQSQQRFARRRDNQARQAYGAAAEAAAKILADLRGPLVTGGDRSAMAEVLADPRLSDLAPDERWLSVPDPRRAVLVAAVEDACAIAVEVQNSP